MSVTDMEACSQTLNLPDKVKDIDSTRFTDRFTQPPRLPVRLDSEVRETTTLLE